MGGGRITAAVAALVTLAGAPAAWAAEGGTLRVNVSTTDVQSLDPAIDYEVIGWTIEFATCAKLVNYPDRPGPAGTQLVPEVAAGLPRVSADGRTYTFRVRPNFRFNDGTHVTAASFAHAFDRALAPKMRSPAASFLQDVVGAKAVATHKATRPAGVTASGSTLRIRLTRAAPDFLARMAMNFFCAIPANLPINANGVDKPPMAGPYYVASREPGRTITLKRNPYYGGSRPHHLAEIEFTMNTDQHQSLLQVEKGEADYDVFGVPPTSVRGLADKYGVNKGRFFAHPGMNVFYVALNTSRDIFGDANMRKAANDAIDRRAVMEQAGYLAGTATDQILPPTMRGFRDAHIYPVDRPNLARAKALAGSGGKAVLYTDTSPASTAQSAVIQANMKQIGIDVDVKRYAFGVLVSKTGVRDEPFDMLLIGWFADYADPYDFINVLLYGKTISGDNNVNSARFDDATFNRRMEQASVLAGPARYATYGRLDLDLMRLAAPWAPVYNSNIREFVSSRVGCYLFQPTFGEMDVAAACLK